MARMQIFFMLTICKFGARNQLIFFSIWKRWLVGKMFEKFVNWWTGWEKGHKWWYNQMSTTDQGSSSLTRLPHPHRVIAAKLFNCPKLPSNDVDLVPINNQLSVERWICFHKLSQNGNQLMVTGYWFPSWEVVIACFLKQLLSIFFTSAQ